MNEKLIRLAERRERLVAQAAAQRATLAQNIEPWRAPLARADQGLAALRYIRNHPVWIIGGVVLLAAYRGQYWVRNLRYLNSSAPVSARCANRPA